MATSIQSIPLPAPSRTGAMSVEEAISQRRSAREYGPTPLTLPQIGQLLWAAQGVTGSGGLRSAPSAGALYPLELYIVIGSVADMTPGVYRYVADRHALVKVTEGDPRNALSRAALSQAWVEQGAAVLVLTAKYERTTAKYGRRGIRYVHMEVGHAAQNVYLQAQALGLATVMVGAFDEAAVAAVLQLPDSVRPIALMPIGAR